MPLYTVFYISFFIDNLNNFKNKNNIYCTKYVPLKNYCNYTKLIIIQSITIMWYRDEGDNICKPNPFFIVYKCLQFIVTKMFILMFILI